VNIEKALKIGTLLAAVFLITAIAYAVLNPPERIVREKTGGDEGESQELVGEEGTENEGLNLSDKNPSPPLNEGGGAGAPRTAEAKESAPFPLAVLVVLIVVILLVLLTFSFHSKGRRGMSDMLRLDILYYLSVFPGATPRELSQEFQISPSSVEHHLRVMGRMGDVFTIKGQKHVYVFPSNFSYKLAEKIVAAKDTVGKVNDKVIAIVEVMKRGGMSQKEISALTSIPPSTVSYLMSKMEEADLIDIERDNGAPRYYLKKENLWKVPEIYHRFHVIGVPRQLQKGVSSEPLSTSPPPLYLQQSSTGPPEAL